MREIGVGVLGVSEYLLLVVPLREFLTVTLSTIVSQASSTMNSAPSPLAKRGGSHQVTWSEVASGEESPEVSPSSQESYRTLEAWWLPLAILLLSMTLAQPHPSGSTKYHFTEELPPQVLEASPGQRWSSHLSLDSLSESRGCRREQKHCEPPFTPAYGKPSSRHLSEQESGVLAPPSSSRRTSCRGGEGDSSPSWSVADRRFLGGGDHQMDVASAATFLAAASKHPR